MIGASSPNPVPEDSDRLKLVRFSLVERAATSATEPSAQLDLQSGTISRQTSKSRPSRQLAEKRFHLTVGPQRSVNLLKSASSKCSINLLSLLINNVGVTTVTLDSSSLNHRPVMLVLGLGTDTNGLINITVTDICVEASNEVHAHAHATCEVICNWRLTLASSSSN